MRVRLPLPAHLDNTQESKRARVMKLRREGVVNERVADRSEAEAPSPSRPAVKREFKDVKVTPSLHFNFWFLLCLR